MKRPLAWIGFSASAAFLIAGVAGVPAAVGLLIAGLVIALLVGAVPRLRALRGLLAVCLSLSAALSAFLYTELAVFRPLEEYAGKTLPLTLEIADAPVDYARSAKYTARVIEGDLPAGTPVTLWVTDADVRPQPFDRVTGKVAFFPPEEEEARLRQSKAEGIVLSGSLRTWEGVNIQTPAKKPWRAALLSVRQSARELVERTLSGTPAAMVKSLCLGDRTTLPESISDQFRACGVSHLLVVSGLHLGMVAGALRLLLRLLRVKRRPASVVTMLAVIGFMLLVGFTPSVKRAGVMLLVLLAGDLFRREADGLNSLGLALLLIGMADPYMVWDVGLQLSAGTTAGILLLYPRMEQSLLRPRIRDNTCAWVRALYRPAQMAAVSLSAMAVLPLLIHYFGEVSLLFLPANLLMVYPATGAVVTGLLGLLCGGWFPPAGQLLFGAAGLLSRLLQAIAGWLSRLPLATLPVRQPYVMVWLLLTTVVLCLFWKRITPPARVSAVAGAVIALMAGTLTYQTLMRPVTTCTFFEVEEGTAALMEWAGGNLLVVTGDDASLMRQVTAELSKRDVERLSAVVLPDLEDKALTGLPLLADNCRVERVVCPREGTYAASVRSLFPQEACVMADTSEITIGDTHRFLFQNGWLRALAGETRFLFAPAHGDAATLPTSWKQVHLAALPDAVAHPEQITAALRAGKEERVAATRGKQDIA